MMADKNLGEVAVFPCSDGVAALARVHNEFKGSDYILSSKYLSLSSQYLQG